MKFLKYFIVLIFSLTAFNHVMAAEATLSWEAPAVRVDGTPLNQNEIGEYRVFYSIDDEVTLDSEMVVINSENTTKNITIDLTPRENNYTVSFAIITVDTDGRKSALSDSVNKVFNVNSTAAPNPPTSLTFTISCGDGCTIEEAQ